MPSPSKTFDKTLAVVGAGGFALQLLDDLEEQGEFVLADAQAGRTLCGHRVLSLDELDPGRHSLIFAVGNGEARRRLAERFGSFDIGELRSRRSRSSRHARIGEGAIICEHVIIEPEVRIGRHFHANIYSYVAHECTIGDFVTFAPRASCNGNIRIGDGAYIGSGAVIRHGTRDRPLVIGENAIVGMGAVVTKDVPANAVVVGNPARPIARSG